MLAEPRTICKPATGVPQSARRGSGTDRRPHRECHYRLDLTSEEVAEGAETCQFVHLEVEGGDHVPTIAVLKRILAVLDEGGLIGIAHECRSEEPEREVAPAPELVAV